MIDLQIYWGETEIFYKAALASKIIKCMQQQGKVVLTSAESRSATQSGLYAFLDELCNSWGWNPKDITIISANLLERHSEYNIKTIAHTNWFKDNLKIPEKFVPWDGSKTYGMFLGRATAERMHAAVLHQTFEYKNQGLTSFQHNLHEHIDVPELVKYLCESDGRYSELLKIIPYSDIDSVSSFDVLAQKSYDDWTAIYQQLALELVFETSTAPDNITFSEKIMKPILYRRPFMLIAGAGAIKTIKSVDDFLGSCVHDPRQLSDKTLLDQMAKCYTGFKFFENAFGIEYDNDRGIDRVNHVFDILHTLIRTKKIEKLHERCQKDVEHNYDLILKLYPIMKKISLQNMKYFDVASWTEKR
jgi:hypothetical protein